MVRQVPLPGTGETGKTGGTSAEGSECQSLADGDLTAPAAGMTALMPTRGGLIVVTLRLTGRTPDRRA